LIAGVSALFLGVYLGDCGCFHLANILIYLIVARILIRMPQPDRSTFDKLKPPGI
jgi:hypothetical protein